MAPSSKPKAKAPRQRRPLHVRQAEPEESSAEAFAREEAWQPAPGRAPPGFLHPAAAAPPLDAPAPPHWQTPPAQPVWIAAAMGVFAVVAVGLLAAANLELDHRVPHEDDARGLLLGALAAGAIGLAGICVFLAQARHLMPLGIGAPMGILALFPLLFIAADYGRERHSPYELYSLGWVFGFIVLGVALLACLIAAAVAGLAGGNGRAAAATLAGFGAAIATGAVLAAGWLLMTFPDQVQDAANANKPAPFAPAVAVAAVLLASAAWQRMRRA